MIHNHLHQHRCLISPLFRIHQLHRCWILMSMHKIIPRTFKFLHLLNSYLYYVFSLVYVSVSAFKFQSTLNFSMFIVVCSLWKAWLNVIQWFDFWCDIQCFWLNWTKHLYELSEVECIDLLSWKSMQSLKEKEQEIRIMTENVSRFVILIVKECVNRNPVRVWS